MSLRRYRGWEPKQIQRGYDRDGNRCPIAQAWEIVTVTEPEFDDNERESWDALFEWEAATCPHCGNLRVICSNPEGIDGEGVYPQLDYCWVTAARVKSERRFGQLHSKAQPDAAGYKPTDGAIISVSLTDDSPDDDFLLEVLPAGLAEQAHGDDGESADAAADRDE